MSNEYDYLFKCKEPLLQRFCNDFIKLVLLVGDAGTGKSQLLSRFAEDTFTDIYISTIGVDFKIRSITRDAWTVKLQLWVCEFVVMIICSYTPLDRTRPGKNDSAPLPLPITAALMVPYRRNRKRERKRTREPEKENERKRTRERERENENEREEQERGREERKRRARKRTRTSDGEITSLFLAILLVYDITNRDSFQNLNMWRDEIARYSQDNVPIMVVGNKCDREEQRSVSTTEAEEYCRSTGVRFLEVSCKNGINVEQAFEMMVDGTHFLSHPIPQIFKPTHPVAH